VLPGLPIGELLPAPASRAQPESSLQQAVVGYLDWALPDDALVFAIPNGGMRHVRAKQRLAAEGLRAGIPDLLVLWRGRPIFIELKARRGQLRPVQRAMHARLVYCGAEVAVCKYVEAVEGVLRGYQVPLRARCAA